MKPPGALKPFSKKRRICWQNPKLINIFVHLKISQKISGRINFISHNELTDPKKYFILNLISKRGVGNAIRRHFEKLGFAEGKDFMLAG